MTPAASRLLARVLTRLQARYGPRPWRRWGSGLSVLVQTILSQNTSAANSNSGYRQLRRRFPTWRQVAQAPTSEVERCIRVSGLSRIKAPRIQNILQKIHARQGRFSLEYLADMDDQAALDHLLGFHGVGPKTACCTLLFSFGKSLFPVDTHIHRIALRLGLIPPATTPDQAHRLLGPLVKPADRYALHILLIEHGRQTCRARGPRCHACCLLALCPFGRVQQALATPLNP